MENYNQIIGNNIKDLRKLNKLTQYDLAERLNYSNKTISRWESGDIVPDVQTLNKLSEFFGVPLPQLFEQNTLKKHGLQRKYKLQLGNKLSIALLFVVSVWLVATILFVHIKLNYNILLWQIFVWTIPISAFVGLLFSNKWGNKKFNPVLLSIINWTLITSIYISIYNYTFWTLYLVGIPIQAIILLWPNITIKPKDWKHIKNDTEK